MRPVSGWHALGVTRRRAAAICALSLGVLACEPELNRKVRKGAWVEVVDRGGGSGKVSALEIPQGPLAHQMDQFGKIYLSSPCWIQVTTVLRIGSRLRSFEGRLKNGDAVLLEMREVRVTQVREPSEFRIEQPVR